MKTALLLIPFFLLATVSLADRPPSFRATSFDLPSPPAAVVGKNGMYRLGKEETLVELALRTGVGFQALVAANPGMDPWHPPADQDVILPYAAILPPGLAPGITVNLAEFRLYYVYTEKRRKRVIVYPVGVGVEGWETPQREFRIKGKVEKPVWAVPLSIRKEHPGHPAVVPPGPDNPLGDYWLELGDGYGIHGTNRPFAVGRQVSHGCLRLYDEHIRDIFGRVSVGTPVRVIYAPIKFGLQGKKLLVEVHRDYLGRIGNPLKEALIRKDALGWHGSMDLAALEAALRESRGLPVPVSRP